MKMNRRGVNSSATNSAVVFDNPNKHVNKRELQMYLCPKCHSQYNVFERNHVYNGKVPLILKCNHTVCEECIRSSVQKNNVTCNECAQVSFINTDQRQTLQEMFPINFYLLGMLSYTTPNVQVSLKLKLKHGGLNYSQFTKSQSASVSSICDQSDSESLLQEKCSKESCKQLATFRCIECDEVYCEPCCQTLHNSARGLRKHKIISSLHFIPELTENCTVHKNNSLEFFCRTCDKLSCCYCITQDHNGHDFYQFSNTNIIDPEKFKTLIENANEKLKRLILAHKNVSGHLKTSEGNCEIDLSIGKYFTHLHAKLQMLESKVRKEAERVKKKRLDTLNEIDHELSSNIRTLNGLINTAKDITSQTSTTKLNVKVLIERLENSLSLPCYLVGDEIIDNEKEIDQEVFENLEDSFALRFKQYDNEFKLVAEDELPDRYDLTLPNELSLLDISDFNRSISKSNESVSSHSSMLHSSIGSLSNVNKSSDVPFNSTAVEGWVKDIQNANTSQSVPNLKIDDRENVIVSHIDTPESFYIQLVRLDGLLQSLFIQIQDYVKNFAPVVKNPEINKLYVVQYAPKDTGPKWFRGRLIDIKKHGAGSIYTVLFIDYGNTSTLTKLQKFREINTELAQAAPYAHKCKLFDLYPSADAWDAKATLHMAQIITGAEVVMVVMAHNAGILEVDLLSFCSTETASIRDALIFVGLALTYHSSADSQCSVKSVKSSVKLHTRSTNFKNGEEFTVYISNVVNCQSIYVQMADYFHHLEHLTSVMTNYYSKKSQKVKLLGVTREENIYVPKKGMAVAVFHNNIWYRATITKVIQGEGSVVVFLVDYGLTLTVNYTQIRKLSDRYCTLECQAVLVKLSHIQPIKDNQDVDTRMKSYLQQFIDKKNKLRLVIVNNDSTPTVAIFELFGTVESCINKNVIQEGLAIPLGDIEDLMRHSQFYIKPSEPKETYVFDLINTIQCTKKNRSDDSSGSEDDDVLRKQVNVLLCKSPDEIFVEVNDPGLLKMQQELHSSLQEYYYKKTKKETRNWQINDSCVAYDFRNKQFFRGVIIDKIDDKFKVMLRDVAQEIVVTINDLFILHNQFKQFRERAVRCHLASVIPAGDKTKWSGLAIEFLQNVFEQHRNVLMTKHGTVDHHRKSVPVVMWYSEVKDGGPLEPSKTVLCNINKLLVKNGLALKMIDNVITAPITNDKITVSTPTALTGIPLENEEAQILSVEDSNFSNHDLKINVINRSDFKPLSAGNTPISFNTCSPTENNELFFACTTETSVKKSIQHSTNQNVEILSWNQLPEEHESTEQIPFTVVDTEHQDWLPSVPFKSKNFYAIVTFVDEDAFIYAHEVSMEPILKKMEEEMKTYFSTTAPEPIGAIWVPGQLCTVKYFVNDNWYRGKIISASEEFIKVFLIDYGNEEECRHEDLRFGIMYFDIPAFANKIKLYQVYPKTGSTWLTSDLDELHKKLVENKIHVIIKKNMKGDAPVQAVVELNKVNINQYMRDYSTNLVMSPTTESLTEDCDSDVIIEGEHSDDLDSSLDEDAEIQSYKHICLPQTVIGQKINVTVNTILNYNEVILEILYNCDIEETKKLFQNISNDIQSKAVGQRQLHDLKVGKACVAKFSEDGEWYRGEVSDLDNIDEGEVHIWFVDFGNFENVPKDCVKTVDAEWLKLPILQYKGKIDGIELSDPSCLDLVIECMSEYCTTNKLAEIISVNPLVVKLYNDDNELAYQDLINQNLLVKTN